jgi:RNA polymerase sigma-70 factor (ECF subfamily)
MKQDSSDFEAFFKQHFPSLCTYCQVKFGFDIDEGKEVVHTAFVKLWESRQALSGDVQVKAYIYKIISNLSLDKLRHKKVKQKHERFLLESRREADLNCFDIVDLKCLAADINQAVAGLPDQMRRIFELSRHEGLKYAEISTRLGISVKTVETQMSRALVKLRQRLVHYLPFFLIFFLLL